jgi:3,2-trans-enoyl-CoA isomerase
MPPPQAQPHIRVERPPGQAYALLLIAKEPVNSFDTQLWADLHAALRQLEADPSVQGVILASGLTRDVFTAGNDLKELYAPNTSATRYADFWHTQSRLLIALYRTRLATCAAIRGACPAGGCCIALCCDHRVMTTNGTMGLNEVALGIPVPKFWARLMGRVAGEAAAERLVLSGRMVPASQALQLGLVDQVVGDQGDTSSSSSSRQAAVLAAAEQWMQAAVKLPPAARAATKTSLRGEFCDAWLQYAETEEAQYGWQAISQPAAVATMASTLKRLSRSKM